jgi:hypothetical protein
MPGSTAEHADPSPVLQDDAAALDTSLRATSASADVAQARPFVLPSGSLLGMIPPGNYNRGLSTDITGGLQGAPALILPKLRHHHIAVTIGPRRTAMMRPTTSLPYILCGTFFLNGRLATLLHQRISLGLPQCSTTRTCSHFHCSGYLALTVNLGASERV